jgi:hypothetical protein
MYNETSGEYSRVSNGATFSTEINLLGVQTADLHDHLELHFVPFAQNAQPFQVASDDKGQILRRQSESLPGRRWARTYHYKCREAKTPHMVVIIDTDGIVQTNHRSSSVVLHWGLLFQLGDLRNCITTDVKEGLTKR